MELLKREKRLRRGSVAEHANDPDEPAQIRQPADPKTLTLSSETTANAEQIENTTMHDTTKPSAQVTERRKEKLPSDSGRSHSSTSAGSGWKVRQQQVPYAERHKRKWEHYIEREDPIEGTMTHRRLARELDELQEESVDLDY